VIRESGNLLVVDDERSIRLSLRTILGNFGFVVVEAARGEEALALARAAQFDAVLLDINMPGMDGIEVCRTMRINAPRLPIVMLTVQDSEDRKVEALDAGADDYITKPFQLRELTARIRAAVRRNRVDDEVGQAIMIGDVFLDPERHLVEKKGRPVHLTPKQFEVLHYLMVNAGRPIPHARLLRSVWGPEYGNELEYLRTFIRQIRIKIEDDPGYPKYLHTESRIGYRFTEVVGEDLLDSELE
jgi:two-component system KDP operon response regulator KdpE